MQTVTTIGLDIAKSVFQVHGVDAAGQVVIPMGGSSFVSKNQNTIRLSAAGLE
jgi:transposase